MVEKNTRKEKVREKGEEGDKGKGYGAFGKLVGQATAPATQILKPLMLSFNILGNVLG